MDLPIWEWVSSLLIIIGIDLMLAGDNAIVIALASRRLPAKQQKKAAFYGAAGAILIRIVATLVVVWLLKIPGLHLVGGLLLLYISYKLLTDDHGPDVKEAGSLWSAIRTIIIADALMGLDNVLAIAGASHGSYWLVVIGLIISVPFIVWGSSLFLKLIERFTWIIYLGGAVLAFTSISMILEEPFVKSWLEPLAWIEWPLIIVIVVAVLILGLWQNSRRESAGTA